MKMVSKNIITFGFLALILFCGVLEAASPKYPTHSESTFERVSHSLSNALLHPVQTVRDVKKFAVAPLSRFFGTYDEKEHEYGRKEGLSSWMYPPHFDLMFSSELDERDASHPKYHLDIDIDFEQPSYLEIVRQVTESLYEGGAKYVTQQVVVTEKIPPRGEKYERGIEEVYPSRVEEAPEIEDTMRKFLRGEVRGYEKAPRHKEEGYEEQRRYREQPREEWSETLKHKGHEIKEEVKGAAKKVVEKAEQPFREMAEGVKERLETAEEKLGDLGEKIKNAGERVVETEEDIRHGLGDTLKGLGKKIIGAEEELRHGFEDKLEDIGDKMKDTAQNVKSKIGSVADKAHQFKDKSEDVAHKVKDKLHEVEDEAKISIHNMQSMVDQLQQNIEDRAKGLANMIYHPIHEFKKWLTGGVRSVGDFVNKESAAVRRTTHDVKNAIARQGEKIHIPPISEKLCDAGQSLLDTVCGGRQHGVMDKSSRWVYGSGQYESTRPTSKFIDVPEPEQEIRKYQEGYHGFVEEGDQPSYGRKYRHSDQVEEEVCRPVYSRGAL